MLPPLATSAGVRLDLAFDDLVEVPHGSWRTQLRPPRRTHVEQICRFARQLSTKPPPGLIVHGRKGSSRAPAAFVGIAAALLGEAEPAVLSLRGAIRLSRERGWRPADVGVTPNCRLIGLLDTHLALDGLLVDAVHRQYPHPVRRPDQILLDARDDGEELLS